MRVLGIICICWLACVPPTPPMPEDVAMGLSDGGDAGFTSDPVVGRPCGPGMYCPCGYFCPIDKCEVADFHPPCGDMK